MTHIEVVEEHSGQGVPKVGGAEQGLHYHNPVVPGVHHQNPA